MALQALLFDVDGTLADTERLGHRPAYNRAFEKLGLAFRWDPKLYRTLLKKPGGQERLLFYLSRYEPDLGDQAAAAAADPKAWARGVHRLKSQYFRNMLQRGKIPLRPGVARLMREAREAGIRIALVTSASHATLQPVLKHSLGPALADGLDFVVCGDEVENKKPAPDLYLAALNGMKLAGSECVAIEDSEMGLASAFAAGIPTVITTNHNTQHEKFSEAHLVLNNLGEPDKPSKVVRGRMGEGWLTLATLRKLASGVPAPRRARAAKR